MKPLADNKYPELRAEIRSMTRSSSLYRLLKVELLALGHWKALSRGNPEAGYKASEAFKSASVRG